MSSGELRPAMVTALVLILVPMTTGIVLGQNAPTEQRRPVTSAVELARHNLSVGWLVAVAGLFTGGLLVLLLVPPGWLGNGIVIGAALSRDGVDGAAPLVWHLIPELTGFVLFTVAGLSSASALAAAVRGRPVPSSRDVIRRALIFSALGTVALLAAAPLEVIGARP